MALTPTCALIAARVALGEWADLGKLEDPHRVVSAAFIRQLLTGLPIAQADHEEISRHHPEYALFVPCSECAPVPVAAAGVRVRGGIIQGILDLADCCGVSGFCLPALVLEECRLEGEADPSESLEVADFALCLDLSRSRIARLSLRKSQFAYIRAHETVIEHGVDISDVKPLEGWKPRPWPGADMTLFRDTMRADADSWPVRAVPPPPPDGPDAADAGRVLGFGDPTIQSFCWVSLTGSRIGGEVIAIDAKLCTPPPRPDDSYHPMDTRYGLSLARSTVGGSLIAYGESVFDGGLNLHLVDMQGEVWLGGAKLIKREGSSLTAHGATLGAIFATARALETYGSIYLSSARIKGHVDLKGANLDGDGGSALHATGATIGGDLRLSGDTKDNIYFAASGPVRLCGSYIGGMLDMEAALLDGNGTDALNGSFLNIGSSACLSDLRANGCIWLNSARIGKELDMKGAHVRGSVHEEYGTTLNDSDVTGETLDMKSAHDHGIVPEQGGRMPNAVSGTGAAVGDSVLLGRRFTAIGSVLFQRARIEKDFCVVNATIHAKDLDVIDLCWTTIAGNLIFDNENDLVGKIRLAHASANILCDSNVGYHDASGLELDGFRYGSLDECDLTAGENKQTGCTQSRTDWLKRMPRYRPQPYAHLVRVLYSQGQPEDAREILIKKHDEDLKDRKGKITDAGQLIAIWRTLSYITSLLFGWMFGYGLKPARAIATILVAFLVGWYVMAMANNRGAMIIDQQAIAGSVHGDNLGAAVTSQSVDDNLPCGDTIQPAFYALDVFIPLVDLRQESKCEVGVVEGGSRLFPGVSVGGYTLGAEVDIYRIFKTIYALAGWLIISLAILTFSGVLQRRVD